MTLGFYENFPRSIHWVESFSSTQSSKHIQFKTIQKLSALNCQEFSFEEVTNPTVPQGKVIFEFGLADSAGFNFIDEEEVKKAQVLLSKEQSGVLDFFCAIRYYKGIGEKRRALKFDYFLLRFAFIKGFVEVQVHHERGPRYVSPKDLAAFVYVKLNEGSARKILKKIEL